MMIRIHYMYTFMSQYFISYCNTIIHFFLCKQFLMLISSCILHLYAYKYVFTCIYKLSSPKQLYRYNNESFYFSYCSFFDLQTSFCFLCRIKFLCFYLFKNDFCSYLNPPYLKTPCKIVPVRISRKLILILYDIFCELPIYS